MDLLNLRQTVGGHSTLLCVVLLYVLPSYLIKSHFYADDAEKINITVTSLLFSHFNQI